MCVYVCVHDVVANAFRSERHIKCPENARVLTYLTGRGMNAAWLENENSGFASSIGSTTDSSDGLSSSVFSLEEESGVASPSPSKSDLSNEEEHKSPSQSYRASEQQMQASTGKHRPRRGRSSKRASKGSSSSSGKSRTSNSGSSSIDSAEAQTPINNNKDSISSAMRGLVRVEAALRAAADEIATLLQANREFYD
jgi:hypothetical protein